MKRFFRPFVGQKYNEGIRGKRMLVIGASFYCNHIDDCPEFSRCTDVSRKDSSAFDRSCPFYAEQGLLLSDEPSHCVGDWNQTYQNFAKYIGGLIGSEDYDEVWSHLAFTNYVQFMLPAGKEGFRETRLSDLSERDFDAFIETLRELNPDIVVVWGTTINSRLKEQNKYLISPNELNETDSYLCHIRLPGVTHDIALINPYHPSSSAWYVGMNDFDKYMKQIINK